MNALPTTRTMLALLGATLLAATQAAGCVTRAQSEVTFEVTARPRLDRLVVATGGWQVRLTRAEIAIGPVYFCAAQSGSATLCETAVGELARVERVDALAGPRALGFGRGLEGPVRSVGYDLGITWFDTQTTAGPAAAAPDGHSLVVEGSAERGADVVPFRLFVDVIPQFQGQRAVPTAAASGTLSSDATRLEIDLDVARWLTAVDFDEALARPERPALLDASSRAHASVLVAMKALAPPRFSFSP